MTDVQEEKSVHAGIADSRGSSRSPWAWVGTLYFAEGIPYVLAMTVSTIMYKKMGISNADIAYYTSLLYLPWVVKPLWSPIVDIVRTKRCWIILMQVFLAVLLGGVAASLPLPNFFKISLAILWVTALSSATHDIAADGFYMLGLSKHQQTWFVGVRSTFYRIAMITGQGLLVILAGWFEETSGLESVPVRVSASIQPEANQENVRFVPLEKDDEGTFAKKLPLEKLAFLAGRASASTKLDEAATCGYLANEIVRNMRRENPYAPEIAAALPLLAKAQKPLDDLIAEEMARKMNPESGTEEKMRIVVSETQPQVPLLAMSEPDSSVTLFELKRWNLLQGQAEERAIQVQKKDPGPVKKLWRRSVIQPLEASLKQLFPGPKKETAKVAGNIGCVYVSLSRAPEPGKTVVVSFGRRKGDKSIMLKEGSRFVFTAENWARPAVAAIQLDSALKHESQALFLVAAGNIPLAWTVTFGLVAAIFLALAIYHSAILPRPLADRPGGAGSYGTRMRMGAFLREFLLTFASFFKKRRIVAILLFLCLYRFAESQLVKMSPIFLLDSQENGGLSLSTGQVGIAYGTVGWITLSIGGILGGFAAARSGLKKWLWLMCLAINVPDLVYVYMSRVQPQSFPLVSACIGIESLGYGFGFTAFMLYMIYAAEGEHKTAHYAICTGFMALGMMLPGMFSGWLQSILGYRNFFNWVMIATIPAFLATALVPLDPGFGKKERSR